MIPDAGEDAKMIRHRAELESDFETQGLKSLITIPSISISISDVASTATGVGGQKNDAA